MHKYAVCSNHNIKFFILSEMCNIRSGALKGAQGLLCPNDKCTITHITHVNLLNIASNVFALKKT